MDFGIVFFSIIALIILSIGFASYYFSENKKIIRILKKIPVNNMSFVKNDEQVKLVGVIDSADTVLIAPISGIECVYYRVKVSENRSGNSSLSGSKVDSEKRVNLIIKQGNNSIIVNTQYANFASVTKREYSSGLFENATKSMESFLNSHNEKSTNFLGFNKNLSYEEWILKRNDTVSVSGSGKWERRTSESSNEKYFTMTISKDHPIYFSNDPVTFH